MVVIMLGSTVFVPRVFAKSSSENIFYYYPNESAYQSVKENYRDIDILAPQIYTVGYDVKLGEVENEDILKLADKKRIDVMPLVVQANFDKYLMTRILDDQDIQDDIIDDLIDEARRRDFIGWQFDFENLNHLDRDKYTAFVKEAHKRMNKKNLILSVAVIPRTTEYDPNSNNQNWSSGYSIPDVAEVSDFVSIMNYDEPHSIGPVASLPYVQEALDFTLRDTQASKISLGVPFYCWQWEFGGAKKIASITYPIAEATQEKYKDNGVFKVYLEDVATEVFVFVKDNGIINLAWCDNEQSLETKLDLVEENDLRGISAWAIGQESKKIWKKF